MLGIVVSRADSASVHIGEQLRDLAEWERREDHSRADSEGGGTVYHTTGARIREFEKPHLRLERPADAFDDPTLVVVASKHAGETGPLLTAHHTGNFGPAEHGGDANDLARACPNAHDRVLDCLTAHAPEGYEVGMECTHHGPSTVGAPSMFVEVGSGEPQWADPEAARAVAQAILDLRDVAPDRQTGDDAPRRHLVGLGGGHYAPRFGRVIRETDWAIGHVAADWGLAAMGDLASPASEDVLAQAFEQSAAAHALVDGDRPTAEAAVEELGYRAVSETWVRETDGIDLGFVESIEQAVLRVDEGLRFGERATTVTADDTFTVEPLPDALLDEARGIDRERTYEAVEGATLAFGTDQGGTRVTGPVVLASPGERRAVVERLATILAERYDTIEHDGDVIVAREKIFDPERAKTLGVPEGPAFGKLADGEAVEVDGETIPPGVVRETREQRFQLQD